ncbi:hypothetical protein [Pseudomaricurvus sp. HS19]|uniref:hypothetical protein n=1 Tax=Pseudomaricurvus sp. HS19 TaxID=2692626 RepID=UPI0013679F3E|nr:hypothetical protein [Pseudomaricurvus sp. HS19]MYM61997.1 hypothetical protein [Pseudomaricurvus sp. HS19]
MADSLNFHKMHVDCSDEAVDTYEPGLIDKLLGKEKGVDTYDGDTNDSSTAAANVPVSAVDASQDDSAGITFNIREPFTATGGPQSALNGLFAQMIHYCPKGWEKKKEWAEPSEGGYFLYYQFRCAE